MADTAFWAERVRRYGHTGWSDFATYWYDQRLRLKAIEQTVLGDLPPGRESALDFGCGVGDFCAALAPHFRQVIGYDASPDVLELARRRNPGPGIAYGAQLDAALAGPHDLILSVTVLQHIVDDAELRRLLARFAQALAPGGRVVVLETLADAPSNAGYLKRRTLPQLTGLFAAVGLALVSVRAFYHPTECPTPAYRRYRSRFSVRVLGRLAGLKLPLAEAVLRRLARRQAEQDHAFLDQPASPTKILVFGRKDELT